MRISDWSSDVCSSDLTVALAIALLAIRLGKKAADRRRTFGYSRFEIIAAAFNAGMLFIVAIYILYEAWERLMRPPEIESVAMLIIAAIGLAVNFLSMRLLATGKDKRSEARRVGKECVRTCRARL